MFLGCKYSSTFFHIFIKKDVQKLASRHIWITWPTTSEASKEVANLTERKNPHTHVYVVKEFVTLSVCLWQTLTSIISGLAKQMKFFGTYSTKSPKNIFLHKGLVGPRHRPKVQLAVFILNYYHLNCDLRLTSNNWHKKLPRLAPFAGEGGGEICHTNFISTTGTFQLKNSARRENCDRFISILKSLIMIFIYCTV